jgi:purine-binding chemotaxis protein CheW
MTDTATQNKINQYLTFRLADEEYAIDVSNIREILEYAKITKIPCTYDYMQGVINLRGNVVPVVNFHLKFNMEQTEKTVDTCIIVMEVTINNEVTVIGAIADSVEEVIELDSTQVEPPPGFGTKLNKEFIKGIGKRDDDFIIIIDINKAFSEEEINEVSAIGGKGAETKNRKKTAQVKKQKKESYKNDTDEQDRTLTLEE